MTNPLGLPVPDHSKPQMADPNQPHVRILICHVCQSIEELPDYSGPVEHDQILDYKLTPHEFPSGTPHRGLLVRVPTANWDRQEFKDAFCDQIEGMVGAGHGDGVPGLQYDLKSNFKEDAFNCWRFEHNRTTDCGDYQSRNKALYADTKAERKEAGMDTSLSARPKHFLCDYCPVQSLIDQKKRAAAKMYDRLSWESS
jgi:hypothetical protein